MAARGRPKEPEGRRVNICAKFSEAEAEAVITASGSMGRSEWVRQLVLAELARQQVPAARANRRASTRRAATAAVVTFLEPEPITASADGEPCQHPKADRLKGRCRRCRTFVGFD